MKILRVIATMDPASGGPCQGIRNSIPALAKLGVQNDVVSFDDQDAPFFKNDKFQTFGLGKAIGPYAYNKNLSNWLNENISQYDAVIIHGLWLYNSFGTYNSWKRLKTSIKVPALYVMPHGMLDPYFQKAPERKLKAIRNRVFWKLFEANVINNCSGVLFTCQQELELARTTFTPYKPKRELNIGYGIQEPPSYRSEFREQFLKILPKLEGKVYWLFLSRIHSKKGVDLLINSYLKLSQEYFSLPELVIAGPGLETDFGKDMVKLGSHPKIHFPGMLSGNSKWGAFYGCEAFILPSHQENFGIAVAEAMACKKPVLISDQVNIWKEIHQGKAGRVFHDTESGTYQALSDFISLDQYEKEQMGLDAYNTYKTHFSIETAAQKMFDQLNLNTL